MQAIELYPEQALTEQFNIFTPLIVGLFEVVKTTIEQLKEKYEVLAPQIHELLNLKVETAYNRKSVV